MNNEGTKIATRKGRELAAHLIDSLNSYVEENFKDEADVSGVHPLVIAYGIDVFFSDCIFSTSKLFRGEGERLDDFIKKRMTHLAEFMCYKANGLGLE